MYIKKLFKIYQFFVQYFKFFILKNSQKINYSWHAPFFPACLTFF